MKSFYAVKSWTNGRSESPVAAATAEEEKGTGSFLTAEHEWGLLLTDKEELAGLAQPDKKGDRNLRMLTLRMREGPLVASQRLGFTNKKALGVLLVVLTRVFICFFWQDFCVCTCVLLETWRRWPLKLVGGSHNLNFGAQFQWLEGFHQSEKHESG